MRLTDEEFSGELRYQTIIYFVRKMLAEVLISEAEYDRIEAECREKFRPVSSSLLSGKFLLCASIRANIGTEKETRNNGNDTEN